MTWTKMDNNVQGRGSQQHIIIIPPSHQEASDSDDSSDSSDDSNANVTVTTTNDGRRNVQLQAHVVPEGGYKDAGTNKIDVDIEVICDQKRRHRHSQCGCPLCDSPADALAAAILGLCTCSCCLRCNVCYFLWIVVRILWHWVPYLYLAIGLVYFDQCNVPGPRQLPILLIVRGSVHIGMRLVTKTLTNVSIHPSRKKAVAPVAVEVVQSEEEKAKKEESSGWMPVTLAVLSCLWDLRLFAFGVAGLVLILPNYTKVSYVEGEQNYCHPVFYEIAFWRLILDLVHMALYVLFDCGDWLYHCFQKRVSSKVDAIKFHSWS